MPPSTNPHASDDRTGPARVEHQYDRETPPSVAIVRALAALENVDPIDSPADLGITLYEQVDPEALDQLLADTDDAVRIDLTLHNDHRYDVRIRETDLLVVETDV